jgi:epoxyqueuosine reductase QueG
MSDFDAAATTDALKRCAIKNGASIVGVADFTRENGLPDPELSVAVVIGLAFDSKVVKQMGKRPALFHDHLNESRNTMHRIQDACEIFLRSQHFKTRSFHGAMGENFAAAFSHKMAATKAGLGWIGKSSLFLSTTFGPAVRLGTLFTDAPLVFGTPITECRCGDCVACVGICPCKAIKCTAWYPGIPRDDLVDAAACDHHREARRGELGFRDPCGLCIQACPVGRR